MSEKQESSPKSDIESIDPDTSSNTTQGQNENQGRRKFIKGASAVTPIILSVASRPVWARNCSLSGQLSGNLSDQDNVPCGGEGCNIRFWSGSGYTSNAYHPTFPAHRLFFDVFGRDAFPGKTLYEVVSKQIKPTEMNVPVTCGFDILTKKSERICHNMLRQLGAQAVAALQNAASPMKYDLDVETVIRSFQQSYDNGSALAMGDTNDAFHRFNNQICPLP